MNPLGTRLWLTMGSAVPRPASPALLEALDSVEVEENSVGRSGFQIRFLVRRAGLPVGEFEGLAGSQARGGARVVLAITVGARPRVLIDGVVTRRELDPGSGLLTLTGEDLGVLLDAEERVVGHPGLPPAGIVARVLAPYARHGIVPRIVPPTSFEPPNPVERVPIQHATDLRYLEGLASRFGFVFAVRPGTLPMTSVAYWGPPERVGVPQAALSINMGAATNVQALHFRTDALQPRRVVGRVQDARTGKAMPVRTLPTVRPPLGLRPAVSPAAVPVRWLDDTAAATSTAATARAQARVDDAAETVVVAEGELDTGRYGAVLRAPGLVGVRGAGFTHDGLYAVRRVSHRIERGAYTQKFTLARTFEGALSPAVRP